MSNASAVGAKVAPVPRGLVAVAFLKARFDEHADHLDMFMPLVADAVSQVGGESFGVLDVRGRLAERHGLTMPQHTVATLLGRSVRRGFVSREGGRYRATSKTWTVVDIPTEQARIEGQQHVLAATFRQHARTRGLDIESDDRALTLILEFVERQQVAFLLDGPPVLSHDGHSTSRELGIVAEFVRDAIQVGGDNATTIRDMLEGLVLYSAAFLPNLADAKKRFSDLRVFFDSGIVRQALGYEGPVLRALAREAIDIFKSAGIQVLAFDKTVLEIRRILMMFEHKLATSESRRTIRPGDMARHFLREGYSPGDVAQMGALLDRDIASAGIQVAPTPERIDTFTHNEKALAALLADPALQDEDSPRVTHDVDCVAGILTLRRGVRATRLEDAKVLFVTSTPSVVKTVARWWREQGESCVPPIAHIGGLSNLAWLKRPAVAADFKLRELVALCTAALHPSRQTWERFLRHLDGLRRSKEITSDEEAVIVISSLSDKLLSEAELADGDGGPDEEALGAVVDRVKAAYAADALKKIAEIEAERDAAVAAARDKEASLTKDATSKAEELRELELRVDGRARGIAGMLAACLRWPLALIVIGGASAVGITHLGHGGWVGAITGLAVVVFVFLEALGILGHLKKLQQRVAAWLTPRVRHLLLGGSPSTEKKGEAEGPSTWS